MQNGWFWFCLQCSAVFMLRYHVRNDLLKVNGVWRSVGHMQMAYGNGWFVVLIVWSQIEMVLLIQVVYVPWSI